jgi:predicted nucleic acid-binding protein
MNVVDSSGWLEYFSDGPSAGAFLPALQDSASLVAPVVTIYEVFKVLLRERGENEALQAAAAMQKGLVVDVSAKLAVEAARLSHKHGFPMADSLVLATAQAHAATVWTQDAHFRSLPGVKYFPKRK